jgi:hypothetical protein
VAEQRAERGRKGWRRQRLAGQFGGGEPAREQADAAAFNIALAARDLPGEADVRPRFQPQRRVEQLGRADEGVAVQATQPCELGILQAGDRAEQPDLIGMLQLGLEADDVPERPLRIVWTTA